ncbi:MAG: Glu/Leu/Phe/Val dehydrogenase dimerization domain-containing protein [Bdellovibrionota bacterium]
MISSNHPDPVRDRSPIYPNRFRFDKAQLATIAHKLELLNPEITVDYICVPELDLYGFRACADLVPGNIELIIPLPPLGGTRCIKYPDLNANCLDAIELAEGMLFKNTAANLPLSGAKTALFIPENFSANDRAAYFEAYGKVHAELNRKRIVAGKIPSVTAEDSGVTVEDLKNMQKGASTIDLMTVLEAHETSIDPRIAEATRKLLLVSPQCLVGLEGKSGDPSPMTAYGVFQGGKFLANLHLQKSDLKGVKVAIKGIAGNVGYPLAMYYLEAGAEVYGSDMIFDIADDKLRREVLSRKILLNRYATEGKIELVSHEDTHRVAGLQIYAPCALSNDITPEMVEELPEGILIAGAANIPIAGGRETELGLATKGIYYAPHFIINCGGVINVCQELVSANYDKHLAREATAKSVLTGLRENYAVAAPETSKITPTEAAELAAIAKMEELAIKIAGNI